MNISFILNTLVQIINTAKLDVINGGYYPSTIRKCKKLTAALRDAILLHHKIEYLKIIENIDKMLDNGYCGYGILKEIAKIR